MQDDSHHTALGSQQDPQNLTDIALLEDRDELQRWIRWIKTCPVPLTLELSSQMRSKASTFIDDETLERIDSVRKEFLERIGLRIILLPSGSELAIPLRTPPGAMAYGKLLYGGVTRYRMIGSFMRKRRAGERSLVYDETITSWLQYGGPERNYKAIDMGPCALVELVLTPKGFSLPLLSEDMEKAMVLCNLGFDPLKMFDYVQEADKKQLGYMTQADDDSWSEDESYVDMLHSTFTSSVGGLRPQIESIVRRVLDGRVILPASDQPMEVATNATSFHQKRSKEAKALADLGLEPVRGLLLHGLPGVGKVDSILSS